MSDDPSNTDGPPNPEAMHGDIVHADFTPFVQELQHLINKYSYENGSDTPDFILANFLQNVLVDWNHAVRARDRWYGQRIPT